MIKGIIFDFGNTLAESPCLKESLYKILDDPIALQIGSEIEDKISKLYTPDQKIQPQWIKIWDEAFKKYNYPFEEKIGIKHLENFMKDSNYYSYTKPILEKLSIYNIKTILLSNMTGPPEVFHNEINNSEIRKYFTDILWSCEIGYRKPSVEAFNIALDRLNLNANEVLMVGDSEIADIIGANNRGIRTLRVYDGIKPLDSKAEFLSSRIEMINILNFILDSETSDRSTSLSH